MRDIELFKDYETARLFTVGEFHKAHRETTVSYDDLETTDVCGIPVAVTRNGSGKLDITFVPDTHVLAIGATRSGKTTGFVIPTLNILAKRKNKPSIVISDPKQELYKDHIAFFKEMGYDVILLNFNDYMHSDCWNPLTKYYRLY
ncbi:MAG: type IV secretory system conjugative DNA transfer family protein, partial [Clostridia bacterium]|nr:type IV secretory system conjugative DNA transfer family protein [Clostridia bacterium]